MDNWGKLEETPLPTKETFCSNLILENISNEDSSHGQKVWEVFEIKIVVITATYMFKVIHYFLQMCLQTLELCVLKYMNLILHILYPHQD